MNKQGPLKAIPDKGGLRNISENCVPTVCPFLKKVLFKISMCAVFFSSIIITDHHGSTPVRKERPDQLKMWSNINSMLESICVSPTVHT